jgi:hypothetical protein
MDMATKRDASITFFPVRNGDTSLITLSDGTNIVIDANVTVDSKDADGDAYDVHAHLLRESRRDTGNTPHVDAFILSHPDQDHLRGFETTFFLGAPTAYSAADRKEGRIIIDELWFAPRIFCAHETQLCEDAKDFRREARRRMDLWKKKSVDRDLPGNRIRIIGFTDSEELAGLDDVVTVPGNTIAVVNGSKKSDFEFFVHGPFKEDTDDENGERNHTSVVLQARFSVDGVEAACLGFFGGDAGSPVWERIYERSSEKYLLWDLLLAPHHCSWTFFSETKSEDDDASETVLKFLGKARKGAVVVASSKPIVDDDDNPPHFVAAERYRKQVGSAKLLCTADSKKDGVPVPIVMSMTSNGPVRDTSSRAAQVVSSAAIRGTVATPKTYG